MQPVLQELSKRYGNIIRHIYKHYTVNGHKHPKKAAEASLCAKEQGKFWEYHDVAFSETDLTVDALILYAKRLGLKQAEFNGCLDSGRNGPSSRGGPATRGTGNRKRNADDVCPWPSISWFGPVRGAGQHYSRRNRDSRREQYTINETKSWK